MPNPVVVTLQFAASVANGICLAQNPVAAGALTLNGALVTAGVATMDAARRIAIASSGADGALVFTITGTDRYGSPQSETLTGVTSVNTPYTAYDYLTVTSVTTSAGSAGNITVGTNGVGSSPWFVEQILITPFHLRAGVINAGGATFSVERTYDDPNAILQGGTITIEPGSNIPPVAWPQIDASQVTLTTLETDLALCFAHRLTIYAGTTAVKMQSIQAGEVQ